MAQIDIDFGKLLGFRLLDKATVAALTADADASTLPAAKTGLKEGAKFGPKIGAKLGGKLGAKAGGKLTGPARG